MTPYIFSYKIDDTNLDFLDVYKLELPFYLKKEANNDTLWIIDSKEMYFWVFRKDRDIVKLDIELPDTIYKEQQNIPIVLKIENTRPETLSLRNPAYMGNAYPYIEQEKKEIPAPVYWWNAYKKKLKGIKLMIETIKTNNPPSCVVYDTIHIKGYETLRINYEFTLDKLFNFKDYPSGRYNISFKFFYEFRDEKEFEGVTFLRAFSNKKMEEKYIEYIEEQYIMSDEFTFHLQ